MNGQAVKVRDLIGPVHFVIKLPSHPGESSFSKLQVISVPRDSNTELYDGTSK